MARRSHPASPPAAAPSPAARPSWPWTLLAILALALGARLAVLAALHDHLLLQPGGGLDSEAYLALGRRIAGGDLWAGPEPFVLAPLYAYFLGALLALGGGSLLVVKLVQVALGTLAVALVYDATKRLGGRRPALVAAGLAAACGSFAFHEVLLLQAALDPLLSALALAALARALDGRPGLGPWLYAGAAFGLWALNRPNALLVAGCLALALLWRAARTQAARWRPPAGFALGVVLLLAPCSARHWWVTGEWVVVSAHGGLNFYIGNHAAADGTYVRVPGVAPNIAGQAHDARRVASQAVGRRLSVAQADAWFYSRAWDWWRTHPGSALRLLVRKLAYVFNAAEIPLNFSQTAYTRDTPALRVLFVGPGLLLPLGLVGLGWNAWHARRAGDPCAVCVWALFVPAYAVAVAAFFVASRYRLPLLVPACVGTGLLTVHVARAVRPGGDRRPLWIAAAALAAVALVVHRDWGLDDGVASERAALAEALADNGRGAEVPALVARAEAELGRDVSARRAMLLERAGRALLVNGRAADAWPLLERAADIPATAAEVLPRRLAAARAAAAGDRRADALDQLRRLVPLLAATAGGAVHGPEPARERTQTYLGLGALALEEGDAVTAEQVLQLAAAGIDTLDRTAAATLHEKLGLARALQGGFEAALEHFEAGRRLDPGSASLELNRAALLAQLGRRADALAALERALALRPDYPQALALKRALGR